MWDIAGLFSIVFVAISIACFWGIPCELSIPSSGDVLNFPTGRVSSSPPPPILSSAAAKNLASNFFHVLLLPLPRRAVRRIIFAFEMILDISRCTAANVSLAINPQVDPNRDHKAWVRSVYDKLSYRGKEIALCNVKRPGSKVRENRQLEWQGDAFIQLAITYLIGRLQNIGDGLNLHVSFKVCLQYPSSYPHLRNFARALFVRAAWREPVLPYRLMSRFRRISPKRARPIAKMCSRRSAR